MVNDCAVPLSTRCLSPSSENADSFTLSALSADDQRKSRMRSVIEPDPHPILEILHNFLDLFQGVVTVKEVISLNQGQSGDVRGVITDMPPHVAGLSLIQADD